MADNKDIAFKLEIDGVEQSIKSVKDLKSAIKSLQDEAENADLGSDQYKNAIENIEKLNDKLKEVTQTEKQAAQAMEDMAESQKEAAKETGDLRKQFEKLEDELFLLAGQGKQNTKEFRDLANEAALLNKKIEQVNQSLEGGAATKSAEGFQMLSGGLTSVKDGLLELDFAKVKDGLMQAKQGFVMFGQGAKTALQGVKGALIATGIGALVVLLGTIIAYWDDIKGAIDGVSSEQKKLNAAAAENLAVEQERSKALDASTNSLKLQGLSEREILELKVKQLDVEYEKAEVALLSTIQTQIGQVEAEKRNKAILQGLITMITAPMSIALGALDLAGKALGKNFGLGDAFRATVTDAALGDEKENEEKRKKELDAQIQLLKDLKEKRAGFQLSIKKIDEDAEKTSDESLKEITAANLAAIKAIEDAKIAAIKDEELRAFAKEVLDNERRIKDIEAGKESEELKRQEKEAQAILFENNLAKINADGAAKRKAEEDRIAAEKKAADEKAAADKKAADEKAAADKKALDDKAAADKIAADAKAHTAQMELMNAIFEATKQGLDSIQAVTDIAFKNKLANVKKGSKEEEAILKKQFELNKAFQIAGAIMNGIQGVLAITTVPDFTLGVATALRIGTQIALAATSVAKIASTKFEGGNASAGGGGGSAPMPSIPAPPTIATSANNTNQTTSFDENGKNLDFKQPTINVTATVGVDEIANKTNRVSVLEQQSTF
jgi:hypothetical protein